MSDHYLRSVVIVGGGVAAWIAAVALARVLPRQRVTIRVVEPFTVCSSEAVVEAGESCLPSIRTLHRILGIDERDFMLKTHATFKLGAELRDWVRPGEAQFHPFGEIGASIESLPFHHHWLRMRRVEDAAGQLADYSLAAVAASLARFAHPASDPRSVGATLDYAYHLDIASYAAYLRAHAEKLGVERLAGVVLDVSLRSEDGLIQSLRLDGDRRVEGDLYIDASGFSSVLMGRAMKMAYESWSQWLPCDRVVRTSSAITSDADIVPYTTATARSAGWQWRIPLRHRVSHGYVYCSLFSDDRLAETTLREHLDGVPLGQPDVVSFVCGRRKQLWTRNCVALGAAACFPDPLEATHLHLIHSGIAKLLALFPYRDRMDAESDEYNRLMGSELERIRDFQILYYSASRRMDSPFWAHCSAMNVPASLQRKISLFTSRGRVVLYDDELFGESSWACLFTGLDIRPRSDDRRATTIDAAVIKAKLLRMRSILQQTAHAMPRHKVYLDRYCPATSAGSLPGDQRGSGAL